MGVVLFASSHSLDTCAVGLGLTASVTVNSQLPATPLMLLFHMYACLLPCRRTVASASLG